MQDAAEKFINKHYELYGRRVKLELHRGKCDETPPDRPCMRADAQRIIAKKPFMVQWTASTFPDFYNMFARAGIIGIGGNGFGFKAFYDFRPFRYDLIMDGQSSARHVAEYYCKKLAGGVAKFGGVTIHPTIGGRDSVRRKLGVLALDDPELLPPGQAVSKMVAQCSGTTPPVFTYERSTQRQAEQSTAIIAGLISEKVTTVVNMGDGVAPVPLTKAATEQGYFPEWLVSGAQLTDLDILARLYEQSQWQHAFGLGSFPKPVPPDASNATKVWRDSGRSGVGPGGMLADRNWDYWSMLATMLQMAGPRLTADAIHRVVIAASYRRGGWAESNHQPGVLQWAFGPNKYTAYNDFREIYWDTGAPSKFDDRPGSYVPVNGGRRYRLGEWPAGAPKIPVAPS